MELVPIITQILVIVAAVFILVLIVSYGASKIRRKENEITFQSNSVNIQRVNKYQSNQYRADKSKYYGGNYTSGNSFNPGFEYPKEIKVVKRSGIAKTYSSGQHSTNFQSNNYNSRFTVLNSIAPKEYNKIETDEFGFKIYANNEITRSVYMPN